MYKILISSDILKMTSNQEILNAQTLEIQQINDARIRQFRENRENENVPDGYMRCYCGSNVKIGGSSKHYKTLKHRNAVYVDSDSDSDSEPGEGSYSDVE